MKHLLLALPLGLFVVPALGQTVEYSCRGTVSFGEFRGANASPTTTVYQSNNVPNAERSRSLNPYGGTLGVGGGLAVRAQHVSKYKLLTAFDLGYDLIQSRASVVTINYNSTVQPYSRSGSGILHLYNHELAAFGGVGYRFGGQKGKKLALDVLVGPELAYVLVEHESGSGTDSNNSGWSTGLNRAPANRLDFRLRGDVSIWGERMGLVASYSYGFTNYMPGTVIISDPSAEMRLIRVGLGYRLK